MIREFEISCPTCAGWILLDLESGEVLKHGKKNESRDKPRTDPKKFEDAFDRLRDREARGDDVFTDAVKSVEESKKKLDAAFEEAKKKAAKNKGDKPRNPFDDVFAD